MSIQIYAPENTNRTNQVGKFWIFSKFFPVITDNYISIFLFWASFAICGTEELLPQRSTYEHQSSAVLDGCQVDSKYLFRHAFFT
jgi:hypothetical protein